MNRSTKISGLPTVLITGGAGYIGSHAVIAFRESGFPVVVLDDLSTGHRNAIDDSIEFVLGNVSDTDLVCNTMAKHKISAVIHFAGSIIVPESIEDPLKYYDNNTVASRSLISACVISGVRDFIFSSTAAVYGEPDTLLVSEDIPLLPINPYGTSKLMTEWMLRDTSAAHDFNYIALRYFNVAGADPKGRTGQSTPNATHLIKVAVQAALGHRDNIEIFGEDYDTRDGTCIRDYIHVSDLADAHVEALKHLISNRKNLVMNCGYGYGYGYSVKEVLETVRQTSNLPLRISSASRRSGDPKTLVANSERIRQELAWCPRYQDLSFIVKTAMDWEVRLQAGA